MQAESVWDWAKLKHIGFGLLELKPDEFWELTYAEFEQMVKGYELRQEMEMQRTAWLAANLMNVHLKRKVTVQQLLGKSKSMSKEDKISKFEELKHKLEKRRAE